MSLEVHSGQEQQEVMVEIMNQAWKGMLLAPSAETCQTLPSPGELRKKILIKVKAAPSAAKLEPITPTSSSAQKEVAHHSDMARTKSVSDSSEAELDGQDLPQKPKRKGKIVESLSALGVYTRSYHFKDFRSPQAKDPTHVFSLSEKKLSEMHDNELEELFRHNMNYLMRAYPSGTRVSSSNLDPSNLWRKGVQMAALNWQKFDAV